MSLAAQMELMLPAIEEELHAVIDRTTNPVYPVLRGMLAYHLGWEGPGAGPEAQGKRIRPLLVLLCAQASGGDWRAALPAAAAVELLHNFSLIHDDIQDNSPLRRGRETVWKVWGIPQAINAGDVMFTKAFRALHRLEDTVSMQAVLAAHRVLEETCLKLTEGQYLDISFETRKTLPLEDYWAMIAGKTSALLGCCAELGALAGGADETCRVSFREYGVNLGLAFQVLDDWLGIWGDTSLTGKSIESDLGSGKKTLPVLYGLDHSPEFAGRWEAAGIPAAEIENAVLLLGACGADQFTLAKAEELTRLSLSALDQAVGNPGSGAGLYELTTSLLKRKK